MGNNNVPGLVSDSDGSLIRDISNPVIEKAVLVTKAVSYKSSPSGEDMSKLYCQIACFLQVNARTQFLSYKVFYSLKLNL